MPPHEPLQSHRNFSCVCLQNAYFLIVSRYCFRFQVSSPFRHTAAITLLRSSGPGQAPPRSAYSSMQLVLWPSCRRLEPLAHARTASSHEQLEWHFAWQRDSPLVATFARTFAAPANQPVPDLPSRARGCCAYPPAGMVPTGGLVPHGNQNHDCECYYSNYSFSRFRGRSHTKADTSKADKLASTKAS